MLTKTPVDWIKEKLEQIRPSVKWTFLLTFLCGILVHLYVMTHKFFNYFEMGNIFSKMPFLQEDTVGLGRWFMPVATNLFTDFSMPVVNGIISLFYMALSAALIVDMLQIKSRTYSVLFGLSFVTFPGLTCVFSYGVNCDELTLSLLLAVLAGYLFIKREGSIGSILAGIVLLCLSLGAYQPYMSATIGVIYMALFLDAFRKRLEWKPLLIKMGKAVLMLAAGFILYYLILQLTIHIAGVTLSDYHGVDSMTSFTPKGIAKGLVYTYGYFLAYFFSGEYIYTGGRIFCNVIGAAAFFVLLFKKVGQNKKEDRGLSNLVLLVLTCVLPVGVNAAPFLMADRVGNGVDRYMIFSLMFLWALLLAMLDDCQNGKVSFVNVRWANLCQWAGGFAVCAAIVGSAVICNQAYHRMEAMTETTGSLLNRIAARMEVQSGWNKDMPVYFVNCRALVNLNYEVEIPEYEAIKNMPGTFLRSSYSEEAVVKYMEVYLHFPVKEATAAERERVEQNPAFEKMRAYPAEDSIQVIDGVMVVKISEGEEYS